MWIVTGPFDKDGTGGTNHQKSKLLKTGVTYSLGRRDCPLLIPNKKISANHGDLVVGPFSVDDIGDPTRRPKIEYVNKRDKGGVRITRPTGDILVHPRATQELQDGDTLSLVTNILITIKWEELCCYAEPIRGKSTIRLDACADLGIHVAHVPHRQVTHHVLPMYSATPVIAASLLSACQFIRLEWVEELIRLGSLPNLGDSKDDPSLEQNFILPLTNKYRPGYSESLTLSQKEFRVWEPNEGRLSMFSDHRFLCVDEKGRELSGDFRELIERGNGSFEIFDPSLGKDRFHRALTRGRAKEGKTLVVIGKRKSIQAAVGLEQWNNLVNEANEFGLVFIEPEVVVQVVIEMDVKLLTVRALEGMHTISDSFPNVIPNTHSDEPTIPPEPQQREKGSDRLVRRVASRLPSQELPSNPILTSSSYSARLDDPHSPRPPPRLTRRLNKGKPIITGLDDPSSILDSTVDVPSKATTPPPPVVDLTAPTPARSTTLKRRVVGGVPGQSAVAPFALALESLSDEPQHKKFKALFDASDQKEFDEAAFDNAQSGAFSQTQSQTQNKRNGMTRSSVTSELTTLREEEEETQHAVAPSRGIKRPINEVEDSLAGDTTRETLESGKSLPKKRAIDFVNSVERISEETASTGTTTIPSNKPASTNGKKARSGAQPGKPDQDHEFLKAIASTKKGKKAEDEFDREFNKLKISKPALERDDPEDEWAVLAQFGDETNLRGNFMVIVEMPAYNRNRRRGVANPEWNEQPNFKKFKKKILPTRGAKIKLFLSHSVERGISPGEDYWQDDKSPSDLEFTPVPPQNKPEGELTRPPTKVESLAIHKRAQKSVHSEFSEQDTCLPRRGTSKAPPRTGSAAPPPPPSRSTRQKKPAALSKNQPLFISSDEDGEVTFSQNIDKGRDMLIDDYDGSETLPSTAATSVRSRTTIRNRPSRTRIQPARGKPRTLDDDGDDIFTGFG